MNRYGMLLGTIFFALLVPICFPVSADVITASLTTDNDFYAYLSTSDSVPGTLFASGHDWTTTYTATTADLIPGTNYFLHVSGINEGGPAGLLGTFTIDGTLFHFANGTQTLETDPTEWGVNTTGFGSTYTTPTSYGANGVGPWGSRAGIDSIAQWIWTSNTNEDYVYFSAPVIAETVAAVPEPSGLILLSLLGMFALGRGWWRLVVPVLVCGDRRREELRSQRFSTDKTR